MPCVRKIVKQLVREEYPKNVVPLRKGGVSEARRALLEAAVAHCEIRCGGCDLTRQFAPPV